MVNNELPLPFSISNNTDPARGPEGPISLFLCIALRLHLFLTSHIVIVLYLIVV